MTTDTTLIQRIKDLTARFGKGWHDGIQIDASDIADLCLAADALEQQAAQIAEKDAEITRLRDIASDAADDACINALRKENGVGLRPCRSPYCECDPGKCTHPGCYDARHEPLPT